MATATDDLRRTRSRLYAVPAASKPYEPLAIVALLLCLVVHVMVITSANELALCREQMSESLHSRFVLARSLALATAGISLLALFRIWWRAFSRRGLLFAGYGAIVSVWIAWLVSWSMISRRHLFLWSYEASTALLRFMMLALVCALLVHWGYCRATRRLHQRRPYALTIGLAGLLLASTAFTSCFAWAVEGVYQARLRGAYAELVPRSDTAEELHRGILSAHGLGVVLREEGKGQPVVEGVDRYESEIRQTACKAMGQPRLDKPPEDVFDEIPGGPAEEAREIWSTHEAAHEDAWRWLNGIADDSASGGWEEARQYWRSRTLFVAAGPHQECESLFRLNELALEIRPEQSTVMLMVSRSWPIVEPELLLSALRRMPLAALPLELNEIPGAPDLELSSESGDMFVAIEIDGRTPDGYDVGARNFYVITKELENMGTRAVNLRPNPYVPIRVLVRVVDALREAGVQHVAVLDH